MVLRTRRRIEIAHDICHRDGRFSRRPCDRNALFTFRINITLRYTYTRIVETDFFHLQPVCDRAHILWFSQIQKKKKKRKTWRVTSRPPAVIEHIFFHRFPRGAAPSEVNVGEVFHFVFLFFWSQIRSFSESARVTCGAAMHIIPDSAMCTTIHIIIKIIIIYHIIL